MQLQVLEQEQQVERQCRDLKKTTKFTKHNQEMEKKSAQQVKCVLRGKDWSCTPSGKNRQSFRIYNQLGHILRRDGDDVLRAIDFEVAGRRGSGIPKMTWRGQVEEQAELIGLKKKNISNRAKWCNAVCEPATMMRWIPPPPLTEAKPDVKIEFLSLLSRNHLSVTWPSCFYLY